MTSLTSLNIFCALQQDAIRQRLLQSYQPKVQTPPMRTHEARVAESQARAEILRALGKVEAPKWDGEVQGRPAGSANSYCRCGRQRRKRESWCRDCTAFYAKRLAS